MSQPVTQREGWPLKRMLFQAGMVGWATEQRTLTDAVVLTRQ